MTGADGSGLSGNQQAGRDLIKNEAEYRDDYGGSAAEAVAGLSREPRNTGSGRLHGEQHLRRYS
jgi:hypothetical protein